MEVRDRENSADLPVTLIYEYAYALLHSDTVDETDRSKRELKVEAVGYIVGQYFGLDTSGSVFYLAACQGDKPKALLERPYHICSATNGIIDVVGG